MASQLYTYSGKENMPPRSFLDIERPYIEFNAPDPLFSFLQFDDGSGISNIQRIFNAYSAEEKRLHRNSFNAGNVPYIKPSTSILLPRDNIRTQYEAIKGVNQIKVQTNYNAYYNENYRNLVNDPEYVKSTNLALDYNRTDVQCIHENVRVWIWIRALGQIVDVSPFIENIVTTKMDQVGQFNFALVPISDLVDVIKVGNQITNLYNMNVQATDDEAGLANNTQNKDFWTTHLQMNDVVWIRFEVLQKEVSEFIQPEGLPTAVMPSEEQSRDGFFVSPNEIPNKIYDMIGLIDTVNTTYDNANTNKRITIGGRDLMKLLIDDASYLIRNIFRNGGYLANYFTGNANDTFLRRNVVNGVFELFWNNTYKNIEDSIHFIINHLSNIEITPDELFRPYGIRVSQIKTITGFSQSALATKSVRGIWQIIKTFTDPELAERVVVDDSLSKPDGSLLEFINKICQRPFVDFYGDTVGDTFDLIARQPPFNRSAILSVIDGTNGSDQNLYISLEEKDILSYNLDFDTRYYSWYKVYAKATTRGYNLYNSDGLIPTIYMDQYVENFGNKRLIIESNYVPFDAVFGSQPTLQGVHLSTALQGILNDLLFVIETNAYLPFTRMGTIVINGDRRIKRGSFVYFPLTHELFYVRGVTNSATFGISKIDRTTTLTVERGMVFDYIKGVESPGPEDTYPRVPRDPELSDRSNLNYVPYSYFDIVNTDLIQNAVTRRVLGEDNVERQRTSQNLQTDFGTNRTIFNFFLNREQFKRL